MNNFSERSEHPSASVLLRYVDGELLDAREVARLRDHFQACWACRANLEEIEQSIRGYIRFHQRRIARPSALPPGEWREFDIRLGRLEAELARSPKKAFWRLLEIPIQSWMAGAAGVAGAALIFLLLFSLGQSRRLSATALLEKSIRFEATGKSLATRRVRIRYRAQSFERGSGVETQTVASDAGPARDVKHLLAENHLDWNHPLSAQAFGRWHSHLRAKTDEIRALQDRYRLTTISRDGLLHRADFEVLASDFHPVREALDFGEEGLVEISEIRDAAPAVATAEPVTPVLPMVSKPDVRPLPPEPTLEDVEAKLRMLLHAAGADLQDAVAVHQTETGIELTGIVTDSGRKEQLEAQIRNLDRRIEVQIASAEDAVAQAASAMPAVPAATAKPKFDSPAKAWLEAQYPDPADREQSVEQALERSRNASIRAYALAQLAERYPPTAFNALSPEARTLILRIVADHATELEQTWGALRAQLEPLSGALSPEPDLPDNWQSSAQRCAAAARALDTAVSRLLVQSSESGPPLPELVRELRAILGKSYHIVGLVN